MAKANFVARIERDYSWADYPNYDFIKRGRSEDYLGGYAEICRFSTSELKTFTGTDENDQLFKLSKMV